MASAEFSKFAGILSVALSQHHLAGFENTSTGIPSPPVALFVVIHTVKGFSVVNEAEVDIFLKFPYFLQDPANVGNLISASSKPTLYIWKFLVHVLLKPSLMDFEHNLASM